MDKAKENTSLKPAGVIKMAVLIVIFLVYMFPFYMLVLNAFKYKRDIIKLPLSWGGKNGFTLNNFAEAFQKMNFMTVFMNSVIITGVSCLLIILLSSMCAYIFVRKDWKVMIPLISIYGGIFGILNHRATLIFMHVGFSMSMSVFMFHGFIRGGVPIALEEAASIDGAGPLRIFFQIVFPLLKPTIATLVILHALALWNDYLLPSLILTDKALYTIPIATKLFQGAYSNDMDLLMAALVMAIIPAIILYLALQKYIIAGVVAGAVK